MKDLIKILVLMALLAIAVLQSGYHSSGFSKPNRGSGNLVVANDQFETSLNTPVALPVYFNDVFDRQNSTVVFSAPVYGSIYADAGGKGFYYQPKPGFTGQDTFEYNVCLNDICKSATVAIKITRRE